MSSRLQLFPPELVGLSSLFSADLIEECGTALLKWQIRDVLEKSSSKALEADIADAIMPFLKAVYANEQLRAVNLHTVPRTLKKILEKARLSDFNQNRSMSHPQNHSNHVSSNLLTRNSSALHAARSHEMDE